RLRRGAGGGARDRRRAGGGEGARDRPPAAFGARRAARATGPRRGGARGVRARRRARTERPRAGRAAGEGRSRPLNGDAAGQATRVQSMCCSTYRVAPLSRESSPSQAKLSGVIALKVQRE